MNAVVLEGRPLTLVDCGPIYPEARQALEAGLARLGHRVEDIELLILTHFHVDHTGLAAEIRRRSGCRILTHPHTDPWLRLGRDTHRADFGTDLFRRHGGPASVAEAVGESIRWLWSFTETVEVDGFLDEGDQVAAGGRTWDLLHTPGHAYGHISLWGREARGLLAGDHLIAHISSNALVDPVEPSSTTLVRSLPLYLESLARLARLDLDWVASGHGEVITDHRALVASRLTRTEKRLEKIRGFLEGGPATAYDLMRRLFPKLDRGQLFLGMSEVLGHLFVLEDRGMVAAGGSPVTWSLR
ncbi:MAG: MBL fold metallo-hydrolase [Bacillota bacterium]